MSALEMKCDVCGKNESAGVASSAFGAVSWSYCRECLHKPAEPELMFLHLFENVSDNGEGLADFVQEYWTFRDGRYVSWPEYVQERREAKEREETHEQGSQSETCPDAPPDEERA